MYLEQGHYLRDPQQLINAEHTVAAPWRALCLDERLGEDECCFNA